MTTNTRRTTPAEGLDRYHDDPSTSSDELALRPDDPTPSPDEPQAYAGTLTVCWRCSGDGVTANGRVCTTCFGDGAQFVAGESSSRPDGGQAPRGIELRAE